MSEAQKYPFILALSDYNKSFIDGNNDLAGKALPCHVTKVSGAIVTVQFDILPGDITLPEVTIPIFGPEYIRYPVQIGDKGVTVSASVSLRGVSGLGVGMADMSQPPSLTALYFMPIANKNWSTVDPNVVTIYGKSGVTLRTEDGSATIKISPDTIELNAKNIILNGQDLTANGIKIDKHKHKVPGVQGGGDTVESEEPE